MNVNIIKVKKENTKFPAMTLHYVHCIVIFMICNTVILAILILSGKTLTLIMTLIMTSCRISKSVSVF